MWAAGENDGEEISASFHNRMKPQPAHCVVNEMPNIWLPIRNHNAQPLPAGQKKEKGHRKVRALIFVEPIYISNNVPAFPLDDPGA